MRSNSSFLTILGVFSPVAGVGGIIAPVHACTAKNGVYRRFAVYRVRMFNALQAVIKSQPWYFM